MAPNARNPFAGITPDPADHARTLALPPPPPGARLVIHFTPRSSSKRLTEILSRTGRLGQANEVFNPPFAADIARRWKVADLDTYIELLLRRQATGGVYSCEVTAHHLRAMFADERVFLRAFGAGPCLWLIRRDIVAQAVSLAKMVKTSISHSTLAAAEARTAAETGFDYDAGAIRRWLNHIRTAETASEAFFARHGLTPLRIDYEQLTAMAPEAILAAITRHAGLPPVPSGVPEPARQEKIGTSRNEEFARRFRAEAGRDLARIEAARAPMLAQLHDLAGEVPTAAELQAARPSPPALAALHRGLARQQGRLRHLAQRLIRSR